MILASSGFASIVLKAKPDWCIQINTIFLAFSNKKLKRLEGFGEIKNPYLASIEYEKPGTIELAERASEGIKNEDVLILKNHGVICVNENLQEAKLLAVFVEETAKTQFVTYMLDSVED